jgi:DNA-binding MarR family transcriptional regulator
MVTRAVTQLYDEALQPSGLRVTQFSILASIARAGAAGRAAALGAGARQGTPRVGDEGMG